MHPKVDQQRFGSLERLYGPGALAKLARAHVAVIGVGGVGSWAAEALARSGVGALTLIDADDVCLANTNRQSHALAGNIGRAKVAVLAERLHAINPALRCDARAEFLTPRNLEAQLDRGFDAVLDACDSFRVKVEAIAWCRRRKLPIVVCGSAGGRTDPTLVSARDLSRTELDVMLGQVRRKLRNEFGFPRNTERYFGVPAVYSREHPRYPHADGSVSCKRPEERGRGRRLDCGEGFGAAMHVTATFAMVAVSRVLAKLLTGGTGASRSPS
jgi:tRNA A37 threonylcarbamoyladenosine dehydratase